MEDRVHRCSDCDRCHLGRCQLGGDACYVCGESGHFMRDFPSTGSSGSAQPARSVAASSAPAPAPAHAQGQVPQTPAGCGRGRGGAPTTDDPDFTLYYVTSFVNTKFGIEPEAIKRFEVATPVGDSVVTRCVFRGCTIVIGDRSTTAGLIELGMVDFDVILGTDWLSSCYANIDCKAKTVQFNFPEGSAIEWKDELPGLPPEWKIDFPINIVSGKANFIADALSRKSMGSLAYLQPQKRDLAYKLHQLASLEVKLIDSEDA
ncbi:uncharacterized protein [Nicotiana tomentosiformis]|uniref:uncharacterized protein n=1 Tax=Nicotiana tomentosiformis TaxID=4098 RepID=UPI00388C646D